MHSMQRINTRGQNQHGDATVDYLINTEGLSPELEAARKKQLAKTLELTGQDGALAYYYDDSAGATQRWSGALAGELGLAGKAVSKDEMLALARGFHPQTGEALCKNAGEEPKEVVKLDRNGEPKLDKQGNVIKKMEGGHRVGFDITVTPPKSVCIAFAVADDDMKYAILCAHRAANDTSMKYLESKVETRRGKAGRDVIETEGVVIMQADHLGNRDLEMNIHTHNLVFGVSKGKDGQWGTFDAQELYRHRMTADQVYKNELAHHLAELGFGIEQLRLTDASGKETGDVSFEIAGIDRELIETFSSRRQAILDYEAEHGVDRQAACLATRKHKDEPSPQEMEAMWKDTIAAINEKEPGRVPTIEKLLQEGHRDMRMDTPSVVLERLHENEAVLYEHDIVARVARENMGKVKFDELMTKVEEFKEQAGLVEIKAEKIAEEDQGATLSRRNTETRYAAPWMVEWEQEIVHRVKGRDAEEHQKLEPELVESSIKAYEARKGFTLSDEQRKAVEHITKGSGGVAILSGMAGTGKTTVSDAYSEAFRRGGRNMIGVCVSNAAARKLEAESGMPCRSVAKALSMLDKGSLALTEKDVLVIDEAGMIDTNQTRRLLAFAEKGGAKVVLQGDTMQLQPIGAGSGMSLAKLAVEDVQLTEIRRQKNVEDRDIAGMFYERDERGRILDIEKGTRGRAKTIEIGKGIMNALHARGCIDDYDNVEQAMDALVADFMASPVPMDEKCVLASSRAEVASLNNKIREELQARGDVSSSEVSFKAKDNGSAFTLSLAVGDRVRMTDSDMDEALVRTNDGKGVANGDSGVVERIQPGKGGGFDVMVRLEGEAADGKPRRVKFNTTDWSDINHSYAGTVHKSQGQGKEEIYHLANMGMLNNHAALVAFTRLTKGKYTMYGDTDTIERMEERLGLERLKGNAITEGLKDVPTEGITEKLVKAQIERAQVEARQEERSALTDDDLKWIRESASELATAMRTQEKHEKARTRDKGRDR